MKLIESSVTNVTPKKYNLEVVYQMIEKAGRICYASTPEYTSFLDDLEMMEDFNSLTKEEFLGTYFYINEDEYESIKDTQKDYTPAHKFVDDLIRKKHYSPLEHGTVYLKVRLGKEDDEICHLINKYEKNPYSKVNPINNSRYITTNYRVLIEHNWLKDLKYLCVPTIYHEKRYSFEFVCSEGIARELNRHRVNSICQQSTRYCNFSKDKFENELTFIEPYWYKYNNNKSDNTNSIVLLKSLADAEKTYLNLILFKCKPQEAREVLPLALATKLIHTAFESDWKYFCELRCSSAAHPDIKKLADIIKQKV